MKMFTKQFNKAKQWRGLIATMLLVLGYLVPTISQAQTCNTAAPLVGPTNCTSGGLAIITIANCSNAGDGSLSTSADVNTYAGLGVNAAIAVGPSTTTYPAGTTVAAVVTQGGSTILNNIIGGLVNSSSIELTMNGTVVQTIDASSGLIQVDLLNISGASTGTFGGVATVPFNGATFKYSVVVSVLSGWGFAGIAVTNGCATFQNCGTAVTAQSVFYGNGTTGQTGSITIPITTAQTGGTKIGVSGAGFASVPTTYTTTLTTGQTALTIPVTFDGSSPIGNHTVTLTEYDYITGAALPGTCTYLVAVKGYFDFDCANNAATITPTFIHNTTSQTGSIIVPITNVIAGQSVTVAITTVNGFSATTTQTLTAGQTTITIPVTFTGNTVAGSYPLTISSTKAAANCQVTATVVEPLAIGNAGPLTKASGGSGTTSPGNAPNEIIPTLGIAPYTYTVVDCSLGTTTSTTTTTSTQTTAHGSITINKTTGVYTYTPNGTFGVAGDQYCIKVCDSSTPVSATTCQTVTYNVSLATATYAFACPVGALTQPTGTFTANSVAGQVGTIRIPLTGATAGTATFAVSSVAAGIVSTPNPYVATLTANQAYVDVPVTYNGTGVAGTRAITITSPAANTSSTCTSGTVVVGAGFALSNSTPTVTTPTNTPVNSSAATTQAAIAPTGGTAPYTYASVNCTTDLASTASTHGGTISVNPSTGAYTYTPATGYTGTDTYCIKVCDSSTPTNCQTATFNATVAAAVGTVGTFTCNSVYTTSSTLTAGTPSTVTIPVTLNATTAGPATITVSGTGFSGTSSPTLVVGSNNVNVTVIYDGSTPTGSRSITLTASSPSTATCNTTVTVNSGVVNAPTVSSSPSPLVAGTPSTLTAAGCTGGTITWTKTNNGVVSNMGTSNPLSTTPAAGDSYTATCTINNVTSSPSSALAVTVVGQDYNTTITVNSFGQFAVNGTKTYTVNYTNTLTTAATATETAQITGPFGWTCSGCGSVTVPVLAAGQSYTVSVTLTATNAGASGTLNSNITQGSGGDTRGDNNAATVLTRTAN